jgi:hypothetical protein
MLADYIVANIDLTPFSKQTAGQKLTPPYGKPLEHITNKTTFVVYKFSPNTIDKLEYRLEQVIDFLTRHRNFLDMFYASDGCVHCDITVISKKHYIFNLSPQLIQKISDLGVGLGVEIYAEEEDEEDDDCQSKAE